MMKDMIGEQSREVVHFQREFVKGIKPWADFVDGHFSQPKWIQREVKHRVEKNMNYFKSNYAIVLAACSAIFIITSAGLILCCLLSTGFYALAVSRRPVQLFGVTLQMREKMVIATVATLLLLSLTGYIYRLQWSFFIGGTLCILHALFRPPVLSSAVTDGEFAVDSPASVEEGGGNVTGGDDGVGVVGGGVGGGGGAAGGTNVRLRTRPLGPVNANARRIPPPGLATAQQGSKMQ